MEVSIDILYSVVNFLFFSFFLLFFFWGGARFVFWPGWRKLYSRNIKGKKSPLLYEGELVLRIKSHINTWKVRQEFEDMSLESRK